MSYRVRITSITLSILITLGACGAPGDGLPPATPTSGSGAEVTATLIPTVGDSDGTVVPTVGEGGETVVPTVGDEQPTEVVTATATTSPVTGTVTTTPDDDEAKVGVCHFTSSATNPVNYIEISPEDVPDHEAHGDIIGVASEDDCPETAPIGTPTVPGDDDDDGDDGDGSAKVGICHRTGSEKNPYNHIEVSESAVPAHEAHGDIIGVASEDACPVTAPADDAKNKPVKPNKPAEGAPKPNKPQPVKPKPQPAKPKPAPAKPNQGGKPKK